MSEFRREAALLLFRLPISRCRTEIKGSFLTFVVKFLLLPTSLQGFFFYPTCCSDIFCLSLFLMWDFPSDSSLVLTSAHNIAPTVHDRYKQDEHRPNRSPPTPTGRRLVYAGQEDRQQDGEQTARTAATRPVRLLTAALCLTLLLHPDRNR